MVGSNDPRIDSGIDRVFACKQQWSSGHRVSIVRDTGRGESGIHDCGARGYGVQHTGDFMERNRLDFPRAVQVSDERRDALCHQYIDLNDTYWYCGSVL